MTASVTHTMQQSLATSSHVSLLYLATPSRIGST